MRKSKPKKTPPRRNRGKAPAAAPKPRGTSKQAKLVSLLQRAEGARVEDLMKATGWQRHTVRGAISAVLRKRLGLKVSSERAEDGTRLYRIAG